MPDASYCEALRGVAGLLADIPFTREWHVPTGKVVTDWRLPVRPDVTESIFWQAAARLAETLRDWDCWMRPGRCPRRAASPRRGSGWGMSRFRSRSRRWRPRRLRS
jgi:hypothetical protein